MFLGTKRPLYIALSVHTRPSAEHLSLLGALVKIHPLTAYHEEEYESIHYLSLGLSYSHQTPCFFSMCYQQFKFAVV